MMVNQSLPLSLKVMLTGVILLTFTEFALSLHNK